MFVLNVELKKTISFYSFIIKPLKIRMLLQVINFEVILISSGLKVPAPQRNIYGETLKIEAFAIPTEPQNNNGKSFNCNSHKKVLKMRICIEFCAHLLNINY